jgi:hypothetical protein
MSKVVQLRASVAACGFVLPQHLNLMSSDAGDRAGSAGLESSLPIQMTRSPNASLRAIAVFMMMPPAIADKARHGLFRFGAFIAARGHRPSINVRISPPGHQHAYNA